METWGASGNRSAQDAGSNKPKLVRITTVPISMNIILKGQLRYMNQYFEVVGVTGYDEKHFNECAQREGIRMHAIEMARAISLRSDLAALWKLYRFFRKERPAIVHTHTPKAGLLGMIAAFLARVPVRLHTVGGMPLMEVRGLKRSVLNLAERLTYACAQRIYPNSHGLANVILAERFCPPAKVKVIANGGSNGIDVDFFDPEFKGPVSAIRHQVRSAFKLNDSAIVFCFVGRIAREKGIREFLEAFRELRTQFPGHELKMLLIGPFEKDYGVLNETIKEQILNDKDILAPGRFDDVRPYYAMSDVYVFPSYREGFPNTLLEAGAMGLPSIATDINGCNEIVRNGSNGIIIPVKDSDSLRAAMATMLDHGYRRRLASAARPTIEANYRRELIWASLRDEYSNFLHLN